MLVGRRQSSKIDGQRLTMRTVVIGDVHGTIDVGHSAYLGKETIFYR